MKHQSGHQPSGDGDDTKGSIAERSRQKCCEPYYTDEGNEKREVSPGALGRR